MFTSRASASTFSGCAYSLSIRSRTRRSRARSARRCAWTRARRHSGLHMRTLPFGVRLPFQRRLRASGVPAQAGLRDSSGTESGLMTVQRGPGGGPGGRPAGQALPLWCTAAFLMGGRDVGPHGRIDTRTAQRTSWMRTRLPAGSRNAQSRTPYGCSVGSWTTSVSPACTFSNVASRSGVASRIQP